METLAKTEESELDSMRVATANILKEIKWGEGGAEIRKGTKHFRGGAKVYIIDYFPGMCESVTVVGHHRASGRYIELSMPARHLENFRMSTAYSPKVLELIREHYSGWGRRYTNDLAQQICDAARIWAERERRPSEQVGDGNPDPVSS